jgi:hypothetical protein
VQTCKNLDVYFAQDEKKVMTAFGTGSDLHRGFKEALAGGAQRVMLIPLPSDTTYNHTNATIASSSYTSEFPTGDLWDDAWSAIEASQADIVVPWGRGSGPTEWENPATPGNDAEIGFHADNSSTVANSWAKKVGDKVETIINNSNPCYAVLGVAPYIGDATADGTMTVTAIANHLTFPNLVSRDDPNILTGAFVSVVAGEISPVGYNDPNKYGVEFGYSNGAAVYAGYAAQLDSWSAPTGKLIYNINKIRYNPTRVQQEAMTEVGLVPIALNYTRAATWVDATTFANVDSPYTRLTTLRIVFDAIQSVRQIAQSYVGEASTLEIRNAFETAISRALMGMQELGALLRSDYLVTYVPQDNKAVVDLVLWPAFEIRVIEVSVSVQL